MISADDKIAKLVPGKSDAEIAADLKARVILAYDPLLAILDEAVALGFHINIQAGLGGLGKIVITQLQVSKIY
jgi:hypothetical protein